MKNIPQNTPKLRPNSNHIFINFLSNYANFRFFRLKANNPTIMQTVIADFSSTPRASTLSSKLMQELDPKAKSTSRKRKLKSIENSGSGGGTPKLHQTIIDAGQRNIGLQHCIQVWQFYEICGILPYSAEWCTARRIPTT